MIDRSHDMKIAAFLLATLALSLPQSSAADPAKYKPFGLFGGYKDKVVGPNRWRVSATTNGVADEGSAQQMAVYRAAELVQAAGYSYMQIVNQSGSQAMIGVGYSTPNIRGAASMKLEVVGVSADVPPAECTAKRPESCFTVSVAQAMESARPYLRFND